MGNVSGIGQVNTGAYSSPIGDQGKLRKLNDIEGNINKDSTLRMSDQIPLLKEIGIPKEIVEKLIELKSLSPAEKKLVSGRIDLIEKIVTGQDLCMSEVEELREMGVKEPIINKLAEFKPLIGSEMENVWYRMECPKK